MAIVNISVYKNTVTLFIFATINFPVLSMECQFVAINFPILSMECQFRLLIFLFCQ